MLHCDSANDVTFRVKTDIYIYIYIYISTCNKKERVWRELHNIIQTMFHYAVQWGLITILSHDRLPYRGNINGYNY